MNETLRGSCGPLVMLLVMLCLWMTPAWAQSTPNTGTEPVSTASMDDSEPAPEAEMPNLDADPVAIPPNPALSTRTAVLYPNEGPTRVNVVILSGSGMQDVANTLAVLIGDLRRKSLEKRIGLKVEVVNISRLDHPPRGRNVIYYRPPFLRAAMLLAETVPGDQNVQPMSAEMLKRSGIDVEVWVAD